MAYPVIFHECMLDYHEACQEHGGEDFGYHFCVCYCHVHVEGYYNIPWIVEVYSGMEHTLTWMADFEIAWARAAYFFNMGKALMDLHKTMHPMGVWSVTGKTDGNVP